MASNHLSDSFLQGSDEAADSLRSRRSVLAAGSDAVTDASLDAGSEEVIDRPCAICKKRDGTQVESAQFCVDCDSSMCPSCASFHASFPTLNTHTVVHISQALTHGKHSPPPSVDGPHNDATAKTSVPSVNRPHNDSKTSDDKKVSTGAAKLDKEINLRVTEDENPCDITGFCFLPDASMIVADYDNWKVKRLDPTHKLRDWLKVPGKPHGVCYTQNDQVAVTLFLQKMVYMVKTGSQMKKSLSFDVGDMCRGIACSNGELFVCCGSFFSNTGGNIRVFNLKGKSLRHIQRDISSLSHQQLMFSVLQGITISSCGSKIIVSDEKKGLMTLMKTGYLLSAYTYPDIRDPRELCCLDNGDVLICGWQSNNILHVDKYGCTVAVVLNEQDGILQPRGVCYDPVNARLIVANNSSDNIKLFAVPSLSSLCQT